MKIVILLGSILCALVLVLFAALPKTGSTEASPAVVYEAADLVSGAPTSLEQLRGSPVLLSSWATWCVECRKDMPGLEQLWQDWRDEGLQVIAVNLDGPGINRGIRAMVQEYGLTMPVWRDPSNAYSTALGTYGIPVSVLLDREGHEVTRWIGPVSFQSDDVVAIVEQILADSTS